MIEEVMKEIAEAETKAEEIIKTARERAKDILLGGQNEVEEVRKEYAERLKEKLGEINARAEKEGEEKAAQVLKDAKTQAGDLAKVNDRAFAKCVEQISERIGKL